MATVLELDAREIGDSTAEEGREHGCRASTEAARVRAVERAVEAMRQRLGEPLPLEALARAAFSSPYHFNRFFRQVTGLPPCRYLSALRMETAKRLLLTTRMSVTRICFDVGFASLGTFTRHFADDVGMPPQRLRRFALHPRSIEPLLAPPATAEPADLVDSTGSGAAIHGVVEAPEGFRGPVFVGVFPEPIPRGRPAACAVLDGPGEFRVGPLPDGRWHVLAAGVGDTAEAAGLLHEAALRGAAGPVAVRGGRASGRASILLRPPRPIDPPILAPLAVLLAARAGEGSA